MAMISVKKHLIPAFYIVGSLVLPALAEPMVVLEYHNSGSVQEGELNTHPFRLDPDYTARHRVRKNETLSHIIANFYGGSGIDRAFVQMAIIRKNRSAFVRGNPNYLYADKLLHLPSLNEIRAMIIKQPASDTTIKAGGDNRDHIFFFGG